MLYVLMGKSATGKDTVYRHLMKHPELNLINIVPYTTRPMRSGEVDGKQYHFVSEDAMNMLKSNGLIAEQRCYHTVHGDWYYFTANKGINVYDTGLKYITIGTLESYISLKKYYGEKYVTPIYICVDDFTRIRRSLAREEREDNPSCSEVCRRFLADESDFSSELLKKAGIDTFFENIDIDTCVHTIIQMINHEH